MLCDDLVAAGAPGSGMSIERIIPCIRAAHKFVLGPEFAAVADALSGDYTGLVRAFEHCRLPFAETWIEVAQLERPQFAAAPIHVEQFQVRPYRVGFLLSATRSDLSAWKAHMFWSTDQGCSCSSMAMNFDMTAPLVDYALPSAEQEAAMRAKFLVLKPDMAQHPGWLAASASVREAIMRHTDPTVANYGAPLPLGVPTEKLNDFYEIVAELARADWSGEPAFVLAVVGLLNARNVVELETVDHSRLNRARIKRGKLPLFEHKVLHIANRRMTRPADGVSRGAYGPVRGHFVRGHFKTRKTGIYFWHPHARGDFHKGQIEKEYRLS